MVNIEEPRYINIDQTREDFNSYAPAVGSTSHGPRVCPTSFRD